MAKSSITKLAARAAAGSVPRRYEEERLKVAGRGANSDFARALGAVIRARRREMGMTQTQLGRPLTKGFVSEVERGRSLPSVGALVLMAERLQVPVSYLLGEVKGGLPRVYTTGDENEHATAGAG